MVDLNEDHHKGDGSKIFIISARYRKDMQFGWECICGNTSIISAQEVNELDDIKKMMPMGAKSEIQRLAASLVTPDNKKFRMEEL